MTFDSAAPKHQLPVRVYYEDTDAGGVVYYANYLKFFERARTEWLRDLGVFQTQLAADKGILFVVAGLTIEYRQAAKLDDLLTVESMISQIGKASLHFDQRVLRDGTLLASANVRLCCVHAETFRPTAIPDALRNQFISN